MTTKQKLKMIKPQKLGKKGNIKKSIRELKQISDNDDVQMETSALEQVEFHNAVNKKKQKKIKQEIDNDVNVQEENSALKVSNKVNKAKKIKTLKKKVNNDENLIMDNSELKNNKVNIAKKQKKLKVKVENKNIDSNNEEILQELTQEDGVKKPKKQKKRKSSENDMLDSGDETNTGETPKKKIKKSEKESEELTEEALEQKTRTIFIGNVPINTTKKTLKKHFRKYGVIESLRIRGIPVANPKLSKRVAVIKQEFHPERNNCLCYIRYKKQEDAAKAEAENGMLFEGHRLRVHCCLYTTKPDETKAIFIGNLSFDATEDQLWKAFEICGPISNVRIIRDKFTGMGKGFAYVNFKDSDAVQLALEMEDVKFKNRVVRISLCNSSVAKKNKTMNKRKEIAKPGQPRFKKPFNKKKNFNGDSKDGEGFRGNKKKEGFTPTGKKSFQGSKFSPSGKKSFQGSKFTDKKKAFKKNKGLAEKKKKIDLIAPKVE